MVGLASSKAYFWVGKQISGNVLFVSDLKKKSNLNVDLSNDGSPTLSVCLLSVCLTDGLPNMSVSPLPNPAGVGNMPQRVRKGETCIGY